MQSLSDQMVEFIESQPFFIVATAAADGRVNVSPKGLDTLRVLGSNRVVWLNLTGSGNETAAHVAKNGRMTLMFSSITEMPMTVRLYGTAKAVHPRDPEWADLISLFPTLAGSRQIFDVMVDEVLTSCGSGVPVMQVTSNRGEAELEPFYAEMSSDELDDYWTRKNTESIDGFPTHIFTP